MGDNIQPRVVSSQQLSVVLISRNIQLMVALTKNEEFSNKLNLLLDLANCPPKNQGRARWFHDFVKKQLKIDVSYEAARKWLSGESIPYTKRIGKIAKGLNCTTEYLIGESEHTTSNNEKTHGVQEERAQYSMNDIDLLNKIKELSPTDQARLEGIINVLNPALDKKTSS